MPTANSEPDGITAGPDRALWFTEYQGNKIGRITTAGVVTEYPLPTAGSGPEQISPGPDGALWFTENYVHGNKIGRITTAGVITEFPLPAANSLPQGITAGPDGALWFTEWNANKIARITTTGVIKEYPVPTANSQPDVITAGPDGALWFTEYLGNKIGRITTTGNVTEYPIPTAQSSSDGLTPGPDGALWFTEYFGNKIGRITPAGVITEYSGPAAISGPDGITVGSDGELWFTETGGNSIGELFFVTATLTASLARGPVGASLTFTGSGFTPNETVQIYKNAVGSPILVSATADSSGSFTAAAQVPESPYGSRLFVGVGQTSSKLGAANFSITPRLLLQPNSGPVGSPVSARGTGFGPLGVVAIYWITPPTLLGTATADINGTITGSSALTFTVPSGARSGVNRVEATGLVSATAFFTVP